MTSDTRNSVPEQVEAAVHQHGERHREPTLALSPDATAPRPARVRGHRALAELGRVGAAGDAQQSTQGAGQDRPPKSVRPPQAEDSTGAAGQVESGGVSPWLLPHDLHGDASERYVHQPRYGFVAAVDAR
jgi:hypothetical protein